MVRGSYHRIREENGEAVYRYHVPEEMERSLDGIVSQSKAEGILGVLNQQGFEKGKEYLKLQLPDVDFGKYDEFSVFMYVADRVNRD